MVVTEKKDVNDVSFDNGQSGHAPHGGHGRIGPPGSATDCHIQSAAIVVVIVKIIIIIIIIIGRSVAVSTVSRQICRSCARHHVEADVEDTEMLRNSTGRCRGRPGCMVYSSGVMSPL